MDLVLGDEIANLMGECGDEAVLHGELLSNFLVVLERVPVLILIR